jgi:hypothetical protein
MSATAPRTAQATPDMRQLGVVLFALALGVALLAAVTFSQAGTQVSTAPAAGAAPVAHDHGWIDASYNTLPSVSAPVAHDHGWIDSSYKTTRPAIRRNGFDKAHAPGQARDLVVSGLGAGIFYTGIPYPAPAPDPVGGSNGTRFAQ